MQTEFHIVTVHDAQGWHLAAVDSKGHVFDRTTTTASKADTDARRGMFGSVVRHGTGAE